MSTTSSSYRRENSRQRLRNQLFWKVPAILALVSFAIWWQWRQEQTKALSPASAPRQVNWLAQAVAGVWQGEVTYHSGDTHTETFFFAPEGNKLFGTVTSLGARSGIENGTIGAEQISFSARFDEKSGDTPRQLESNYTAHVNGSELSITKQDSDGKSPLYFKLTRSPERG
jgi:hypothetical protein